MTAPALVEPHQVALTYGRVIKFDRHGGVYRVALYVPRADRKTLRELATLANCGNRDAAERLRQLPQDRYTAAFPSLASALRAVLEDAEQRLAAADVERIVRLAETMGWAD